MKYLSLLLITFYQRFISPYKGFNCAHHVLHGEQTCSNAVKDLILKNGLLKSLPLIRMRFSECRNAFETLSNSKAITPRTDIPCDVSIGDCGSGAESISDCPCDSLFPDKKLSRKSKRRLYATIVLIMIPLSYIFYGQDIAYVYIKDQELASQNTLQRITQREDPQLRVLVVIGTNKHYSNIAKLEKKNIEYKLEFEQPLKSYDIDQLQVLDARVNIGNKLVVVSQTLDKFEHVAKKGQGKRFSYRLRRRWHFWE